MDFDLMIDALARGEDIQFPRWRGKESTLEAALVCAKYIERQEGRFVPNSVLMELSGLSILTIKEIRNGEHWAWFELERQGYRFKPWVWRPRPTGTIFHWESCRRKELDERKAYGIDSRKQHKEKVRKLEKTVKKYNKYPPKTRAHNVLREMYQRKLKRKPIAHTLRFANEVGLVEWNQTEKGYLIPEPVSTNAIRRRLDQTTKRVSCSTRGCKNYAVRGFEHCGTCEPENKHKQRPDVLELLEKAHSKRK
ncbi:hypothetical protein MD535_01315 [Vibrio sp. ZSDZ65]|uniref:Phage protein n=1 Tax=Vibrio qingdaonensis TaxID=2829491 RepID=A0A9X3CK23_9VIBR|nr:hypothetical protein [Vibrio qingdaonensis]MCW8344665.1 hypothetical protein [Vibrio qingdaonensis]